MWSDDGLSEVYWNLQAGATMLSAIMWLWDYESNLSKQSFVGGLDLLPLDIAASRQQLQDDILVGAYSKKHHS